jgi:hypothetical protein
LVEVPRIPADLSSQAARNAELRRLFVKPTVRLSDDDTPGVFEVYVQDEQSRQERYLDRIPAEPLARLLACLPDGCGPSGVTLAVCCYQVGLRAGRGTPSSG